MPLSVATVENDDERIGGDRRRQLGAEDLVAVIGADEMLMMSRGMMRAVGARPEAGLHDVRDQRLDLDDLAALRLRGNVDEGAAIS